MSEYQRAFETTATTPAEALTKSLRAEIMQALCARIERHGWNQSEAAKVFGVSQPRISDLQRGKMSRFGLEGLLSMAANGGLRIELRLE